jgi:hypothetical protein
MADGDITSRGSWEETSVGVNRATLSPNPSIVTHPIRALQTLIILCSLGISQPSQRRSRWDEIRAEHSRSMTTRSSWDELRQSAGRPKSENTGSDQARRTQDPVVDRLTEQQKFDAMLEAERQRVTRG